MKAALGAGREVVVYAGADPNASTFMAATGARLVGPLLPRGFKVALPGKGTSVVALEVDGHPYRWRWGLQNVNARQVGLLGVAVDREPLAAARRRASTTLVLGAMSALLLAIALSNLLARRMTRPLQNLHSGALAVARGDLDTSFAVDTDARWATSPRRSDHDAQLAREPGGARGARARAGHRSPGRPRG